MSLPLAAGLVLFGLLVLAGGGELLVRGATALARQAGVTPAVIGLTVVAMGTSLPELVVSATAAVGGQPAIAVGNVIGSNIFNVVGVLGITALITLVPVTGSAVKLEWPVMALVSCLVPIIARDGLVDRAEGAFLLASLVGFTAYMVNLGRRQVAGAEEAQFAAEAERRSVRGPMARLALALAAVGAGLLLLVFGGRILVLGAVELARFAGLTERVIGLTVVAIGTSMPEVAASVVAAVRGRSDVAVANLLGSNIFNILGILGVTAMIQPVPVAPETLRVDLVWMLVTAFVLFPVLRSGMRVTRVEGLLLLGIYAAYLVTLLR